MNKVAQKVLFEPIGNDLLSKVPVRMAVFEDNKFKIKFPLPKHVSVWLPNEKIETFNKIDDGFVFHVTSSIKNYNNFQVNESHIWKPFMVSNCKISEIKPTVFTCDKFIKINQKFKISGRPHGYFQLICNNWRVKHNDQYFSRDDIISFHYGKNRPTPWPLINFVDLEKYQTFVPVVKGSCVNILVDKSKTSVDPLFPGSKIKFISELDFGYSFQGLGKPLSVFRYSVLDPLLTSESIIAHVRNYANVFESRAIVFVPVDNGRVTINEPYSLAKLLTQGCSSVKMRTRSLLPVKISPDCPVTLSGIFQKGKVALYMLEIRSPCPSIIIEKNAQEWAIRCPF